MNRKSIKGIYTKPMDAQASEPVIENRDLPQMKEASSNEGPLAEKAPVPVGDFMDNPIIKPIGSPNVPDVVMQKFEEGAKDPDQGRRIPEQKSVQSPVSGAASYVVLRMRVQNGVMAVIGSKKVDSPLVVSEDIVQGGLTYEATLENSRISLGSIPDFGEQRSFPKPGTHEHFITELPSFDFNLRLPSEKISLTSLPKLNVSLYRFKELVPVIKLNSLPLHAQYNKEVRVVAQLNGIHLADLKSDVKESINRAFRKE